MTEFLSQMVNRSSGVNLFLFQGLCVDDAQGQRRLGIKLLDVATLEPDLDLDRCNAYQTGQPGNRESRPLG